MVALPTKAMLVDAAGVGMAQAVVVLAVAALLLAVPPEQLTASGWLYTKYESTADTANVCMQAEAAALALLGYVRRQSRPEASVRSLVALPSYEPIIPLV